MPLLNTQNEFLLYKCTPKIHVRQIENQPVFMSLNFATRYNKTNIPIFWILGICERIIVRIFVSVKSVSAIENSNT